MPYSKRDPQGSPQVFSNEVLTRPQSACSNAFLKSSPCGLEKLDEPPRSLQLSLTPMKKCNEQSSVLLRSALGRFFSDFWGLVGVRVLRPKSSILLEDGPIVLAEFTSHAAARKALHGAKVKLAAGEKGSDDVDENEVPGVLFLISEFTSCLSWGPPLRRLWNIFGEQARGKAVKGGRGRQQGVDIEDIAVEDVVMDELRGRRCASDMHISPERGDRPKEVVPTFSPRSQNKGNTSATVRSEEEKEDARKLSTPILVERPSSANSYGSVPARLYRPPHTISPPLSPPHPPFGAPVGEQGYPCPRTPARGAKADLPRPGSGRSSIHSPALPSTPQRPRILVPPTPEPSYQRPAGFYTGGVSTGVRTQGLGYLSPPPVWTNPAGAPYLSSFSTPIRDAGPTREAVHGPPMPLTSIFSNCNSYSLSRGACHQHGFTHVMQDTDLCYPAQDTFEPGNRTVVWSLQPINVEERRMESQCAAGMTPPVHSFQHFPESPGLVSPPDQREKFTPLEPWTQHEYEAQEFDPFFQPACSLPTGRDQNWANPSVQSWGWRSTVKEEVGMCSGFCATPPRNVKKSLASILADAESSALASTRPQLKTGASPLSSLAGPRRGKAVDHRSPGVSLEAGLREQISKVNTGAQMKEWAQSSGGPRKLQNLVKMCLPEITWRPRWKLKEKEWELAKCSQEL